MTLPDCSPLGDLAGTGYFLGVFVRAISFRLPPPPSNAERGKQVSDNISPVFQMRRVRSG